MNTIKKIELDELVIGIEEVENVTPKFNRTSQTSDAGDSGEDPNDT